MKSEYDAAFKILQTLPVVDTGRNSIAVHSSVEESPTSGELQSVEYEKKIVRDIGGPEAAFAMIQNPTDEIALFLSAYLDRGRDRYYTVIQKPINK